MHRLWEPLASKHRPNTSYAAKFSTPFCIAVGLLDLAAGFGQFTEARVHDPAVQQLAAKVSYVVDPDNPYPANFTGHLRVTLDDGTMREIRQDHMRGGNHAPLTLQEVQAKFRDNARYGGWTDAQAAEMARLLAGLFKAPNLKALAAGRG